MGVRSQDKNAVTLKNYHIGSRDVCVSGKQVRTRCMDRDREHRACHAVRQAPGTRHGRQAPGSPTLAAALAARVETAPAPPTCPLPKDYDRPNETQLYIFNNPPLAPYETIRATQLWKNNSSQVLSSFKHYFRWSFISTNSNCRTPQLFGFISPCILKETSIEAYFCTRNDWNFLLDTFTRNL